MTTNSSPQFRFYVAGAAALLLASAGGALTWAEAQTPRLMAPPVAADGTLSFADLVERVSPAVVSILVEREVKRPQMPEIPEEFERFFNFRFGLPPDEDDPFNNGVQRMEAQGSGFFIDRDGHIVTNHHVVDEADSVRVRFADGKEMEAQIVGVDRLTDLAVLKVAPQENQPFVDFADDVNIRVGDWVVAVGNPFGFSGTVTSGIVSAIGGQTREDQYFDYIQIDAPINRGNSGGPTFDLKGRVIGVNRAIYTPTGVSAGIGFAIPAKVAKETVAQLIANGSVTRGWLGVSLQPVTTEMAAALGLKERAGVLVNNVFADTPAEKAGLMDGDIILEVGGENVNSTSELSRRVASFPPGSRLDVKIQRDDRIRDIRVTLGDRPEQPGPEAPPPAAVNDSLSSDIGLRVEELTDSLRQRFGVPDDIQGVIVTGVRPGSPAAQANLVVGVVISEVDRQTVASPKDLNDKIENAQKSGKDAVFLRLQLGENQVFGALSLVK
jgi:serine protease Do